MPKRRFNRRRRVVRRKRFFRRGNKKRSHRRGKLRPSKLVNKSIYLPDRYFTKMIYEDRFVFNSTLVGNGFKEYRGNDIFDPDATMGTGQKSAGGYDSLAKLYRRYRVYASKVTLVANSTVSNGVADFVICSVLPMAASETGVLGGNDGESIRMQKYCKTKQISGSAGMNRAVISNFMSTARILNVPRIDVSDSRIYDGDSYAASNGLVPPTVQWNWVIWGQNQNPQQNSITVVFRIRIKYYVMWYEPLNYKQNFLEGGLTGGVPTDPVQDIDDAFPAGTEPALNDGDTGIAPPPPTGIFT